MSWWKFKGDPKKLFGNPTVPPKTAESSSKDGEKLASTSLVLVQNWCNLLENTVDFCKIHDICKEIFNHFDEHYRTVFTNATDMLMLKPLMSNLLELICDCSDKDMRGPFGPIVPLKMIAKTFYKITFLIGADFVDLDSLYGWYGMLESNTGLYKRFSNHFLMKGCLKNIKEVGSQYDCTTNNSEKFPMVLETILKLFELIGYYGHHDKLSKRLWGIITLNLESPVPRVRALLLMIFQYVITDVPYFNAVILPHLLDEWPWSNRNKYNMLAMIFARHKYAHLLKAAEHKNLKPDVFFKGIEMSLRYDVKTMRSSQALVKALVKEKIPDVDAMVVGALNSRPFDAEFRNAIKYWLPMMNMDKMFELMEFNVQKMVEKIEAKDVVFRNIFDARFKPDDAAQIANAVRTQIETLPNDDSLQRHVLEIFIKNVVSTEIISPFDLFAIIRFLKHNAKMISLHKFMLQQMTTLLKHFIKSVAKSTAKGEDIPESIRTFAEAIKADIYYELSKDMQTVDLALLEFTLRMYDQICKTLHSETKAIAFVELWKFDNNAIYYDRLLRIQQNPSVYSNTIRETSLQLLLNTFNVETFASKQQKTKQFFETCKLFVTGSTLRPGAFEKSFVAAPIQAKLLIQLEVTSVVESSKKYENLNMFYGHLRSMLEYNYKYDASKRDPLQTLNSDGRQLCGYVNCLSEFLLNKEVDLTKISSLAITAELVGKVMVLMLSYLNFDAPSTAKVCDKQTDLSMVALMEKSSFNQANCNRSSLKDNLLTSICYTIQAAAKFLGLLGQYLLHNEWGPELWNQVKKTLLIFEEILYKCSHEATVTVVGKYYGQLLKLVFEQRGEKLLRPGLVEYFKLMDMEFMEKLKSIMENSEANRRKSVCGMATIFSEMIANDVRYEKDLLKHVLSTLKPDLPSELSPEQKDVLEFHSKHSIIEKIHGQTLAKQPSEKKQKANDNDSESSGWNSWSSTEATNFSLGIDDEVKLLELSNKIDWKKIWANEAEQLKRFCAQFGVLQLEQLIMLLEHPKMYLLPALVQHLNIILYFVFYMHCWGSAKEQEINLRLYNALLQFYTQKPATSHDADIGLNDQWQPPTISIAELMQKHNFVHFLDYKNPSSNKFFVLFLDFLSNFDYRNTIVRVTDVKARFGQNKWRPSQNSIYLCIFGGPRKGKSGDEDYGEFEKYDTKMEFLDNEELRMVYAKFHAQIVLPTKLEEFIKTDLKLLIEEFFVETPNENRMIFEALHIYYMIKRAVVHCNQILLYDMELFYKELQDLVSEAVSREGVLIACVAYNTRRHLLDLLRLIGCQTEDLAVQQLLVKPKYKNYKGFDEWMVKLD